MDLELIISVSFMLAIVIESIILLKNFFTAEKREIFSPLLFRFLSNSFIYISALLVFITNFSTKIGLEALSLGNLQKVTFGQITLWAILFVDIVTLIILIIGFLTKFGKKDKKKTQKMIDQDKAQDLT